MRLETPIDWPQGIDALDWLASQAVFPKFYWHHRNGREEVVALGQVTTYTDPAAAEETLADGQRVWGGLSFDGNTGRNRRCMPSLFFLPQIELVRQDGFWHLAVNFSSDNKRLLAALAKLKLDVSPVTFPDSDIVEEHTLPTQAEWHAQIDQALNAIATTELEKVVLARRTTVKMASAVSAEQLLKASSAVNPRSFHFMMSMSPSHAFVGSTPERLFRCRNADIETEALAGTTGRGIDRQQDEELANWLLSDSKNRYENQLVVDDIEARLQPYVDSLHTVPEPEVIQLRQVQHLRRPIKATLSGAMKHASILSSLQPTAAVAGLPRAAAYQYLLDNEAFARGWYSGSVGYIGEHQSEFCVALRSALIANDTIHLFAGAGIVPGSDPEAEWQEINRKTATLKSLLERTPSCPQQQRA
uniref:isochorismate synthase n=1 Tax=Thaumasiovibrio occultus TaxID=1891184 RepID=UPI000B3567C7|nr:isochorismate synthase [Thaumasiovibrio occultus]